MLKAEIDLGQILIIVIFVVASFVQWLWKLIQQGREERARRRQAGQPLSQEEKQLRDEAWRSQTQELPSRPPPTGTPPPLNDPWTSVRDIFEKMKEERRREQEAREVRDVSPAPRHAPPPLPTATSPRPVAVPVPPAMERPTPPRRAPTYPVPSPSVAPPAVPLPVAAVITPVMAPSHAAGAAATRAPSLTVLRATLRHPDSLRQAILMRELLGPPKALQSSADRAW